MVTPGMPGTEMEGKGLAVEASALLLPPVLSRAGRLACEHEVEIVVILVYEPLLEGGKDILEEMEQYEEEREMEAEAREGGNTTVLLSSRETDTGEEHAVVAGEAAVE